MEPRIQYAKTADGVSIAFWALGEGMPFVQIPAGTVSHIQLEWQVPQMRRWYEWLAQKRMVVRYDGRGTGLSEREAADYSLDALLLDLEAVIDRLALDKVSLLGCFGHGAVAIAYAARHPERVSHLLLWCASARFADRPPAAQALWGVGDRDWSLFANALAGVSAAQPDEVRATSALIQESVTPEAARAMNDVWVRELDATSLLPKVSSPTLVLHRRHFQLFDVDASKRLASSIPHSRLALLEGTSAFVFVEHVESALNAIDEFLGEHGQAAAPAASVSGLVTILFTDIEGSTALTHRLGDAKAQELLRIHNTIVRDALKGHGGSEVKHTGDGIMASFPSASQALQCAIAIQQAVAAQTGSPLRVRVGLNAGEPVAEEQDLFGTAVQLARRVCDHAESGQILVSDVVRQLAAGKGFLFADIGDVVPKGFEEPVRLCEVRWRESPKE